MKQATGAEGQKPLAKAPLTDSLCVKAKESNEPSPRAVWQASVDKQVNDLLSNGELERRVAALKRNGLTPEKELVAAVRREARSEVLGNDRNKWL